jgi:hypothetical protein
MIKAIKMNDKDVVSTVLSDVREGDKVLVIDKKNTEVCTVVAKDRIPFGNKIALEGICSGNLVYKYGYPIGVSRCTITKGELVHVHNIKSVKVDIPKITATEVLKIMGIDKTVVWEESHDEL